MAERTRANGDRNASLPPRKRLVTRRVLTREILQRFETFIHCTLPVLTGARRKIRMTTDQKSNAVAGSTQEVMKVRYTAKTHTAGGRRGGVSHSDDGRLDVKFLAPGIPGTGTNPEPMRSILLFESSQMEGQGG
jgi:hypothetical protein